MYKQIISSVLVAFFSVTLSAATHGGKTISKILVNGGSGIYFSTQKMVDAENCGSAAWYHIMRGEDADYETEMYSLLLTAKASGSKVTFNISGCESGYPRVTWIFIEE